MDITYQTISANDFKEVTGLRLSLIKLLAKVNPLRLNTPLPGFTNYFKSELQNPANICITAKQNTRVVGYILGKILVQTEIDRLEFKPAKEAFVSDIFVLEPYRNRGIGHKLFTELEQKFEEKGCTSIELSVLAKNTKARELYLDCGYKDFLHTMLKLINDDNKN